MIMQILCFLLMTCLCCHHRHVQCQIKDQPVRPVDLDNDFYIQERLHLMMQFMIDKKDASSSRQSTSFHLPNPNGRKIIKILKATVQNPYGIVFNVTAVLGERDCSRKYETPLSYGPCGTKSDGRFYLCWLEMWHRPWETFIGETARNCQEISKKDLNESDDLPMLDKGMPSTVDKERIKAHKAAEKAKLQAEKLAERLRLKDEKAAERKRQMELKAAEKAKQQQEKEAERPRIQEEKAAEKQRAQQEKAAEKQRQAEEKQAEKLRLEEEKKNEEERKRLQYAKFFKRLEKNPTVSASTSTETKADRTEFLSQHFIVKKGMKMAPILYRKVLSGTDRLMFEERLYKQDSYNSYLQELRDNMLRPYKTCKKGRFSPDVLTINYSNDVLGNSANGSDDIVIENSSSDQTEARKSYRVKLLQFFENNRPPYYGTWRKKCSDLKHGRRPFARACVEFDYDCDSDAEWEEEPADADECASEDEDSDAAEDEEHDDGFIVEHGYLSSDEEEKASNEDEPDDTLDPETRRAKMKVKAEAWKAEKLCKKWEKLKPVCIANPLCSVLTVKPLETHLTELLKSLEAIILEPPINIRVTQTKSASTKGQKRKVLTDSADKKTKIPRCNLIEAYCTPTSIKSRMKTDLKGSIEKLATNHAVDDGSETEGEKIFVKKLDEAGVEPVDID